MTRLLISVRDADEAADALAGGADLVDVKEPARGPLGAADRETLLAIAARVAGRAPLSAALGELEERRRLDDALAGQVDFAKFGLSGCGHDRGWTGRWQAAIGRLPAGVAAVGVAYADWRRAAAPPPLEVLAAARDAGCRAALLDTFDKRGGSLRAQWTPREVARWIETARAARLVCVVAGGLTLADIVELLPLAPDYVGVRGAACRGDRAARLERGLVARLSRAVRGDIAAACADER